MPKSNIIKYLFALHFPLLKEWGQFPAFIGWLGLSVGITIGAFLFQYTDFSLIFYYTYLIFTTILLFFFALVFPQPLLRFIFFCLAGVSLIFYNYGIQHTEYAHVSRLLSCNDRVYLSGTVLSVPVQSCDTYVFAVKADSIFSKTGPGVLKQKTIECRSGIKPTAASKVVLEGRFIPPRPTVSPGGFDEYLFLLSNNMWGKFYSDSIISCRISSSVWQTVSAYARGIVITATSSIKNSDTRAVLVASFINDRSELSDNIKELFFRAGIFHLLALSGFNIAILSSVLFIFLLLVPVGKEIKVTIVLVCIWCYLLFIGPIPSLFRAVVMTSVVLASYLFQKKAYLLNSLGLAGIIWLIFSPLSLFTPGYQLSFSATMGLASLYPALAGLFPASKKSVISQLFAPLKMALLVSVAAFLATAPVLAWHFGTLSLSGIIVNLFAVFFMSVAMWIALFGFFLQMILPPLVPVCMYASELCVGVMLKFAGVFAGAPFAVVELPRLLPAVFAAYALFITGICVVKSGHLKNFLVIGGTAVLLFSSCMVYLQMNNTTAEIVAFMVNKADLYGVRWPNNKVLLAGFGLNGISISTHNRVVAPWLRQFPGATLETVEIAGDPCNSVQFLEPVLSSRQVTTVLSCDSVTSRCPDFISFLQEYRTKFTTIKSPVRFYPSPSCTLTVFPDETAVDASRCRFTGSIWGTRFKFPDTLPNPAEIKGAMVMRFSKGTAPVTGGIIPCWHPLYSGACNKSPLAF
jgi:ComEC/Rec2-related protein